MAVQMGKDLLIKVDMDGEGTFQTAAGLRTTRLAFNAEQVDATSLESGGWRELLTKAGVKTASVTGQGVFRDAETDARLQRAFFDGDAPEFQVIIPDFGIVQGRFQIASVEYAGTFSGEATYELSLASAGVLTFTAVA